MAEQQTIQGANPSGAAAAEFSAAPLDGETLAELDAAEAEITAALEGKKNQPPEAPVVEQPLEVPVAPEETPVPEPAVETPVPEKFKQPDGTLDVEKLEKSKASLAEYLEREKELSRLRQEKAQPVDNGNDQEFIAEIEKGLKVNPSQTIANLMTAMQQNILAQVSNQNQDVRMQGELQEIARTDPGVFTKEGLDALYQVREQNPWLDQSPTPWAHAYKILGGISPKQAAPAPQGRKISPVVPGGQVPPVAPVVEVPRTAQDLEIHLQKKFSKITDPGKRAQAEADYMEKLLMRGK